MNDYADVFNDKPTVPVVCKCGCKYFEIIENVYKIKENNFEIICGKCEKGIIIIGRVGNANNEIVKEFDRVSKKLK